MSSQTSPKAQVVVAVLILAVSVSLYLWPNEQLENTISKDLSQVSLKKLPLLKEQISQGLFGEQTKTNGKNIIEEKDAQRQTEELSQENIISNASEKIIPVDEIESSTVEIKEENEEEINEEIEVVETKEDLTAKIEEIKGFGVLTALFSLTRAVITSSDCGGGGITILGLPGRLSIAECCGYCCKSRHGRCRIYGCQGQCGEGVAYLWDSVTKICGCGT